MCKFSKIILGLGIAVSAINSEAFGPDMNFYAHNYYGYKKPIPKKTFLNSCLYNLQTGFSDAIDSARQTVCEAMDATEQFFEESYEIFISGLNSARFYFLEMAGSLISGVFFNKVFQSPQASNIIAVISTAISTAYLNKFLNSTELGKNLPIRLIALDMFARGMFGYLMPVLFPKCDEKLSKMSKTIVSSLFEVVTLKWALGKALSMLSKDFSPAIGKFGEDCEKDVSKGTSIFSEFGDEAAKALFSAIVGIFSNI